MVSRSSSQHVPRPLFCSFPSSSFDAHQVHFCRAQNSPHRQPPRRRQRAPRFIPGRKRVRGSFSVCMVHAIGDCRSCSIVPCSCQHPRDTRLRQGHQGTHGPASSAAAFLRCCGLHRAGGQLKFNQQSSVPPLHLRSCVLLQLPQLVKPAAKPHRPWRKKAQRERKRMRNDK